MTRIPVKFQAPTPVQMIKPTEEQEAIVQSAKTGEHLVVIAGAGSGKTSTQRMVAKAMPYRRGYYIAYNRAIAEDARGTFPPNVQCSTAHSLAFRAVGFKYQHRLTGERVPARRVAEILGIRGFTLEAEEKFPQTPVLPKHLAIIVGDTVRSFCWSADSVISPKHVPYEAKLSRKQNEEVARAATYYAREAWEDIQKREGGRLRFEHDHYLKMWQLEGNQLPCDFILLDEAQDANPVIAAVVNAQVRSQKILVGDPAQQIYAWRGAIDAMKSFEGTRLTLSQSFRFGQAIADEANEWLELLGDFRITGHSAINSTVGDIEAGKERAILCRTNAEALAQVMLAQGLAEAAPEQGRKVALVGGGRELVALARAAMDLRHGLPTDHRELMLFQSWGEVQEFVHSENAGTDLKVFVKLIDSYGPEKLIQVVDDLYEEQDADLIVSTAHKAKGREWESVRVAPDFEMNIAAGDSFSEGEIRLAYVTVTRAKKQLDPGGLSWIHRDD